MARHTSLYQAPRSPLIQGRTRWERPLWQAWVISALAAFSATVVFGLYEGVSLGENTGLVFGVLAAATAVGAGLGVALARLWAWRWRWIGGVLLGVLFGIAAWYATLYVALSAAGGR